MTTINRISIRSYTKSIQSHAHSYHQLVLPLHGSINIKVGSFSGLVSIGDCVIIKSGKVHTFTADKNARFIVVETELLPKNITDSPSEKVTINSPLLSFIQFIEAQFNYQINHKLESTTFDFLYQLLEQQPLTSHSDKRLDPVLRFINDNLQYNLTNHALAKLAFLSITQFKKVFKESMKITTQQYITQRRMDKAKTLLTHTDTPIAIIAEQVGYQSPSAFSRKFKEYFNDTPTAFVKYRE